jgi:hypothetical protein
MPIRGMRRFGPPIRKVDEWPEGGRGVARPLKRKRFSDPTL